MLALDLMDVSKKVSSLGRLYRVGAGVGMDPGHIGFTWRVLDRWVKEATLAKAPSLM